MPAMLVLILLLLAALAPCPAAGKRRNILYITSYNGGYNNSGYLASFLLEQKNKKHWQLGPINWDTRCGTSPSSVFLDERRSMVYCLDEGLGLPNGSITVYNTTISGREPLVKNTGHFRPPGDHFITPAGPVSATTYGFDKRDRKRRFHKGWMLPGKFWVHGGWYDKMLMTMGQHVEHDWPTHDFYWLAVAHYAGSALSGWLVPEDRGKIQGVTTWNPISHSYNYRLDKPGPNPERQDAPHPHQTLLDPTDEFLLVPDLGADMVRIYQSSRRKKDGGYLDPQPPLPLPAGCGPRHGAFVRYKSKVPKKDRKPKFAYQQWETYFHLVCELNNSITSYKVEYPKRLGDSWYPTFSGQKKNRNLAKSIEFKQIGVQNTFGGARIPEGAAAAEIAVSPDQRFVVVSNRNDATFPDFRTPDPSFSKEIQTKLASDSLATYSVAADGSLKFEELTPAGGSFPRSFAFNKKGDTVAVALQYSKSLVIFSRNLKTGRIGPELTRYNDLGNITSVTFAKLLPVDPFSVAPGGADDVRGCLIEIDLQDREKCHKDVLRLPNGFEWPDDWQKLQEYPGPGTNPISRFPWLVYPYIDKKWVQPDH